jgi:hypothetical protein
MIITQIIVITIARTGMDSRSTNINIILRVQMGTIIKEDHCQ